MFVALAGSGPGSDFWMGMVVFLVIAALAGMWAVPRVRTRIRHATTRRKGDAMPSYAEVSEKVDAIETELRRAGYWQEQPPPRAAFENMGAFGRGTMSFTQWVQFVLIPRVRTIVDEKGAFPRESHVGVVATRESDTEPGLRPLAGLLNDFDALFG